MHNNSSVNLFNSNSTKQNKIIDLISNLKENILIHKNKITLFNTIENTTNNGISKNSSFFPQSSPRGKVIAWCAVFHVIKSRAPNNIKELEDFIRNLSLQNDYTLGVGRSKQYLNEYLTKNSVKSFGSGQFYNLKLIKKKAIETSKILLENNYDNQQINSIKKIKKVYKLKSLYKNFVNNPISTYKNFSNDKLANEMFGKHIAAISKSIKQDGEIYDINLMPVPDYITTDNNLNIENLYHRSSTFAKMQHFNTTKFIKLSNKLNINNTGITLSKWQHTIKSIKNDRIQNTQTKDAKNILKEYAQQAEQILDSEELKKLKILTISCKELNFSLHAQELYAMITKVCNYLKIQNLDNLENETKIRIQDNIARLHMFLTMLVTLHNYNHIKFTAILEPIIHELSILIHEIININKKPFITYEEFNKSIDNEFLSENGILKINRKYNKISICGFPANSGMHAHTLGLYISKNILNIDHTNKTEYSFKEYGNDHYYETIDTNADILEISKGDKFPSIHIVNGSIMNGFNLYTNGIDLNKFVNSLFEDGIFNNNRHNVIILDSTNSDYNNLKLDDKIQSLINDELLSIIIWESWQKMKLLGTDQAQFGRVVVLSAKDILDEKLKSITQLVDTDIIKLDMQIGLLFQVCRKEYNKYCKFNFENGETLRSKTWVDSMEMYQVGPFLTNKSINRVLRLYNPIFRRSSFGFNFVSVSNNRVSAGSEPNIDIKIFSSVLNKLIKNTNNNYKKIVCLNNLVQELNYYFSELKIDLFLISQIEIIELISYLFLVQIIIEDRQYQSLKNKLNNNNILNICNQFLKCSKDNYHKLITHYLNRSKKTLSIITNLKIKLRV
jgi:hypothetical protein